ncbi:PorT family protein [Halosquirtibacter xylanolyticus]|uniref:porin family protein n=1 Tax=Halosquirtibacter xylanolyticus TaxID=3374599 RepID=UPI003748E7AF|nr:PorT family protein [Prolixibacteraceae bacterium]
MRKISIILTLVFILATLQCLKAQETNGFSLRAGLHINELNKDYVNPTLGLSVGAFYSFHLDNLRVQPGVAFTQRGGKLKTTVSYGPPGYSSNSNAPDMTTTYDDFVALNYIEIPINFSLKIISLKKSNNIRVSIEPTLGYCISGKVEDLGQAYDVKVTSDVENINDIKPLNFGVKFGASLKLNHFEPYIGYDVGVSNIKTTKNEWKNRAFCVGLSYYL